MRGNEATLLEVLIVIVVITLLAAIVLPRLLGAGRERLEDSLKARLSEMRNAVARFEKDTGCFPDELSDLVATKPPKTGAWNKKIDPGKFKGPYLTTPNGELPLNPINGLNTVGIPGLMGDDRVGWIYDPNEGGIRAAPGTAVDGTDYISW